MHKQTVLVTGSSRGIGRAIGETFAAQGHRVVFNCNKSTEAMNTLVARLQKEGLSVMGVQADVSDPVQVERMFKDISQNFGPVEVLVNNAGESFVGLLTDMEPHQWQRLLAVNLTSAINCAYGAVPAMVAAQQGAIINISSVWGRVGASCEAVYSAAKGGMDAFTKALAKELAPSNIRVNAVACGVIETSMNQWLNTEEADELKKEIPLGCFGTMDEVAQTVAFLASEQAAYITGQIIGVDGGFYI